MWIYIQYETNNAAESLCPLLGLGHQAGEKLFERIRGNIFARPTVTGNPFHVDRNAFQCETTDKDLRTWFVDALSRANAYVPRGFSYIDLENRLTGLVPLEKQTSAQ